MFGNLSRQNSLDQVRYLFARNNFGMHVVGVLLEDLTDYLVDGELFAEQIGERDFVGERD